MKGKIIFSGVVSAALFFSCKKVVTLNLNSVPPQLVIQCEVTDQPGPYTVNIARSVGFYADNTFPTVSGAVVQISDGKGLTDSLTETSPGNYVTHVLQGQPGNTYTLSVKVGDTSYTAVSIMPTAVPLDSITLQHSGGRFGGKNKITPQANYQDPAGIKNYYQYVLYINGIQFTNDIFANSDRLTDGKYIVKDLRMDSSYLAPGDQLRVDMYSVDENVYTYFNQLSRFTGTGAFNTAAAPANPSTNISNGAYGVFSAHTLRSKTITVY